MYSAALRRPAGRGSLRKGAGVWRPDRTRRWRSGPPPPDADLGALLALTLARLLPLEAGNRAGGVCEEGEWIAAAAIRGSLIVTTSARDTLLQPGQVLLFREVGAYDL